MNRPLTCRHGDISHVFYQHYKYYSRFLHSSSQCFANYLFINITAWTVFYSNFYQRLIPSLAKKQPLRDVKTKEAQFTTKGNQEIKSGFSAFPIGIYLAISID